MASKLLHLSCVQVADLAAALVVGVILGVLLAGAAVLANVGLDQLPIPSASTLEKVRLAATLLGSAAILATLVAARRVGVRYVRSRFMMPTLVTAADQAILAGMAALFTAWVTFWSLDQAPLPKLVEWVDYRLALLLLLIGVPTTWLLDALGSFRGGRAITAAPVNPDAILLSDLPADLNSEDFLHREDYVGLLVRLLEDQRRQRGAAVLAVEGAWGTGKTTILRHLERLLADDKRFVAVWFDPWLYDSPVSILRALMRSLEAAISRRYLIPDLARLLDQYGQALEPTVKKAGFSTGPFRVPEADQLRGSIQYVTSRLASHVVVILDDLDRLASAEFIAVLQVLKLTAELPNVTYVVALDRAYCESVLLSGRGERFLDKFIDVTLPVGTLDQQDIDRFVLREIRRILNRINRPRLTGHDDLDENYLSIGNRAIQSIRDAKRIVTSFGLALEMIPGEVNVIDLLFLEELRFLSISAWTMIVEEADYFIYRPRHFPLSNVDRLGRMDYYDKMCDLVSKDRQKVFRDILSHIFPYVTLSDEKPSAPPLEVRRDQRAMHWLYFPRYFLYRLAGSHISDTVIARFLRDLNDLASRRTTDELKLVVEASLGHLDELFDRLIALAEDINPSKRSPLAGAISELSDLYSRESSIFMANSEEDRALALVLTLAQLDSDSSNIQSLLQNAIDQSKTIRFAVMIILFMDQKRNRIVTKFQYVDEDQLRKTLVRATERRIAETGKDLSVVEPTYWRQVLDIWPDRAARHEMLRAIVAGRPSKLAELLAYYFRRNPFGGGILMWDSLEGDWDLDLLRELAAQVTDVPVDAELEDMALEQFRQGRTAAKSGPYDSILEDSDSLEEEDS